MSTGTARTTSGPPHVAAFDADPYVSFVLMVLRRIPPEQRVAWMAEWMPKTSVLLGLHAAEWDVATRQVAV